MGADPGGEHEEAWPIWATPNSANSAMSPGVTFLRFQARHEGGIPALFRKTPVTAAGWESTMAHVSYTELRSKLASYMEKVCDDHAPLFVTRQNARTVVLLAEEEYEGLMETVHLLKSPANAARLLRSFKGADDGKLAEHELIEPAGVDLASA
jgi:antitoxin YefM